MCVYGAGDHVKGRVEFPPPSVLAQMGEGGKQRTENRWFLLDNIRPLSLI